MKVVKTHSSDRHKLPDKSPSSPPVEQQSSSLIMTWLLTLLWILSLRLEKLLFHLLLLQEAPVPPNTTPSSPSFVNVGYRVELVGGVDPPDGGIVHGWVGPCAPCPHQGQTCLVLAHLTWALAAKSCP